MEVIVASHQILVGACYSIPVQEIIIFKQPQASVFIGVEILLLKLKVSTLQLAMK